MSCRVLITGGAGFVGSHLADHLLEQGHRVRVYDCLDPQVHAAGRPAHVSREVELIAADLRDRDMLRRAVDGVDAIFHLAAAVGVGQSMYEIAHYMEANTQGTANLLQALLDRRVELKKLVVASSMSIYGEGAYACADCGGQSPPPRGPEQLKQKRWEALCPECGRELAPVPCPESKPLQCTSVYALSKKTQEEMALLFGRTYGVPTVALRFFNIYGTRQALSNPYTGVAAIFASRLLNGRAPVIFEDGRQLRDFVNVRDVARACALALERDEADGMALNVGSGSAVSIQEIAVTLGRALGVELPAEISGKCRAGDIRHCFANIALAGRLLGYCPRVGLAEGMSELAAWLASQAAEDRVAGATLELDRYGLIA